MCVRYQHSKIKRRFSSSHSLSLCHMSLHASAVLRVHREELHLMDLKLKRKMNEIQEHLAAVFVSFVSFASLLSFS